MLVSELRRYGGQLIEAHGKTFELDAQFFSTSYFEIVHDELVPPGG